MIKHTFNQIKFNRGSHTYKLKGKKLTSVTTFVSTFEPYVNWDEIAQRKADKEGKSKDLILSQWRNKGLAATTKGTKVHSYIERRLRRNTEKDTEFVEMIAWDRFWEQAHKYLTPVKIEWVVGDYDLGLGGTIDCLFYSEKTKRHHIFDWKTGENFRFNNSYQNLKSPFSEYEDCEFVKYSLQLSAYKLILQKNVEFALGESYVIRLTDDFFKVKCLDLSAQIEDYILTKK